MITPGVRYQAGNAAGKPAKIAASRTETIQITVQSALKQGIHDNLSQFSAAC